MTGPASCSARAKQRAADAAADILKYFEHFQVHSLLQISELPQPASSTASKEEIEVAAPSVPQVCEVQQNLLVSLACIVTVGMAADRQGSGQLLCALLFGMQPYPSGALPRRPAHAVGCPASSPPAGCRR